ncbi:MAG: methionyl-tRNA formyltransferase [Actinobacteria bacterium]|nr:methionyl-tRNA formyltransferase [Actinomycetota bacterium]MBV9666197.1 methionyl-tRNA formyltransferase [Actinomycetota bacterium]MBV9934266.1 methionyl-tRNA formyltransferase [Actinomycetota bacterium]
MAVPSLRALVDAGHDVALVVSQPDKKRGRGGGLAPSPVKAAALELGLPVTDKVDDALEVGAELGVVVAFGRLIKPHVLAELPMVNIHFSLLPRWRGAAPLERAILAGDTETGVCLMQLEEGLDTGPVYACERLAIGPEESADELRARLVEAGTRILIDALERGLGTPTPQEGETTYAEKLDPAELRLDWHRPADELHRVVRLGRAWSTFRHHRLRVLEARLAEHGAGPGVLDGTVVGAGDGRGLELVTVQPEGKGPQPAAAWRNGARPQPGETFE